MVSILNSGEEERCGGSLRGIVSSIHVFYITCSYRSFVRDSYLLDALELNAVSSVYLLDLNYLLLRTYHGYSFSLTFNTSILIHIEAGPVQIQHSLSCRPTLQALLLVS